VRLRIRHRAVSKGAKQSALAVHESSLDNFSSAFCNELEIGTSTRVFTGDLLKGAAEFRDERMKFLEVLLVSGLCQTFETLREAMPLRCQNFGNC
jgi:hypothetical protein